MDDEALFLFPQTGAESDAVGLWRSLRVHIRKNQAIQLSHEEQVCRISGIAMKRVLRAGSPFFSGPQPGRGMASGRWATLLDGRIPQESRLLMIQPE